MRSIIILFAVGLLTAAACSRNAQSAKETSKTNDAPAGQTIVPAMPDLKGDLTPADAVAILENSIAAIDEFSTLKADLESIPEAQKAAHPDEFAEYMSYAVDLLQKQEQSTDDAFFYFGGSYDSNPNTTTSNAPSSTGIPQESADKAAESKPIAAPQMPEFGDTLTEDQLIKIRQVGKRTTEYRAYITYIREKIAAW